MIDTLKTSQDLRAVGMDEAQATAIVQAISGAVGDGRLVTHDVFVGETGEIRGELADIRGKIKRLDSKIDYVEERLEMKIDALENRLTLKLTGIIAGLLGLFLVIERVLLP